jgi:hypothetical protein
MHDSVLPHPAPYPQCFELGNYLYEYGVIYRAPMLGLAKCNIFLMNFSPFHLDC